jgi:hypothetical protein
MPEDASTMLGTTTRIAPGRKGGVGCSDISLLQQPENQESPYSQWRALFKWWFVEVVGDAVAVKQVDAFGSGGNARGAEEEGSLLRWHA